MEAGRQQVNEAREWVETGGAGRDMRQDAETTRPLSALSNSSSSYTVSSASLPRSSPVPSSSPAASSYGEGNEGTSAVAGTANRKSISEEGRRPNSSTEMGIAEQVGLFRRSKSTPSLQAAEEEESGRRTLWGWGKRPNLPPPHFYYCPHQPPRNLELRHEDIPEGIDRVKRIKERIESDSRKGNSTVDTPPGSPENQNNRSMNEGRAKRQMERHYGAPFPYRTPSFGGSMTRLNHSKSNTLPLRGTNTVPSTPKKVQSSPSSANSWRSTLPRDGVSSMYWNGISNVAMSARNRNSPDKGNDKLTSYKKACLQNGGENGEVRVSTSTLERIRARGSSVTYYGGRVVKQGSPADPTHAIMEEIRKQREAEEDEEVGLVEDLNGALKALGKIESDWLGKQDSSYGSAESTPVGTPAPSVAPTPPPPPSPLRPLSPSTAKVVSTIAKKGGVSAGEQLLQPSWSGKCSVVFDFRRGKSGEGERGRDGLWEDEGGVCF